MHTYIYAYIYTHTYTKWKYDSNSDSVRGSYKKVEEEKENDRIWIILKYIASVYEDNIMKSIVSCCTVEKQDNKARVSHRGG
jgi:hypothetical protein